VIRNILKVAGGLTMRSLYAISIGLSVAFGIAPAFSQSHNGAPAHDGAHNDHSLSTAPSNGLENSHASGGNALTTASSALPTLPSATAIEKLSNIVTDAFTIGAEDILEITVWRNQDLSKMVQVRPDGKFSLPVIRDIVAVGKTPSQLADEITRRLKEYVQNPAVAVSVKEVNSYNIFVLGEVVKPGKYPLKSKTTLLQGITIAGGFTPVAARNQLVIFRFSDNGSGMQQIMSSYDDIVLRGGITGNLELKAGDTVVVPSEAMVVFPGQQ
jgi:polysaccharide export outer membrane protein